MYTQDGCKCDPCTDAAVSYVRRRVRQLAYGRWDNGFTDAAEARGHALALRAAGVGYRRMAVLAGLNHVTVRHLLAGKFDRISKKTANGILSIPLDALAAGARVDSTGARRRVEAMCLNGWSFPKLSERCGVDIDTLRDIVNGRQTTSRTVAKVKALYDEIWDQEPPAKSRHDRGAQSRVRGWAERRGFLPAMAWDDDTIDDPDAVPDGVRGMPSKVRQAEDLIDDLEWLRNSGVSPHRATGQLGVSRDTLQQALRRHDRHDLIDWLRGDAGRPAASRMPGSSNAA
jgi:lambda repressor-like predicted transcriptional regulator